MNSVLHSTTSQTPTQNSNSAKKETRWRPSKSQLGLLRAHFMKCKYPTIEQKEAMLAEIKERFKLKLNLSQLTNWFQKERIKMRKNNLNNKRATKIYRKLSKNEIDYLNTSFEKNKYPRTEEMVQIAKSLGVKLIKVENWFKHNRRNLAKEGQIALQQRNYFNKDELVYVAQMFKVNPNPTKQEITDIANHLNCHDAQVKNWFANQKKKIRCAKQATEKSEEEKLNPNVENYKKISQNDKEEELCNIASVSTLPSDSYKEPKTITPSPLMTFDAKKQEKAPSPLQLVNNPQNLANMTMNPLLAQNYPTKALTGIKRPLNPNLVDPMEEYRNLAMARNYNESFLSGMAPNPHLMYPQLPPHHKFNHLTQMQRLQNMQEMELQAYKKLHTEFYTQPEIPAHYNVPNFPPMHQVNPMLLNHPGLSMNPMVHPMSQVMPHQMMVNMMAQPRFTPSLNGLQGKMSPTEHSPAKMANLKIEHQLQPMNFMANPFTRPANYMNYNF